MKKLLFSVGIIFLMLITACQFIGYKGTLEYGQFCGAYYISANDEAFMIDTTNIGNISNYVGKQVVIKGSKIDGPYTKTCPYQYTIQATEIKLMS